MPTYNFKITNLTCEACVKLSVMALKQISGVSQAAVDLNSGATEVLSNRELSHAEITTALATVEKTADIN